MSATVAGLAASLLSAALLLFTGPSSFSGSLQSPDYKARDNNKDIEIWQRDKNGNENLVQVDLIENPSSHLKSPNLKKSYFIETCQWIVYQNHVLLGPNVCNQLGKGYFLVVYTKDPTRSITKYECCKIR